MNTLRPQEGDCACPPSSIGLPNGETAVWAIAAPLLTPLVVAAASAIDDHEQLDLPRAPP